MNRAIADPSPDRRRTPPPAVDEPGPLLEIRALRKEFVLHGIDGRRVVALDDVDLRVGEGEHLCLAGSSGAGKSTLLKCIFRTYLPSAGSVRFRRAGGDVVELATLDDGAMADLRELDIGYVSQFLRAEPRRGVLDVVTRAGLRRGLDPDGAREAAASTLERLGIDQRLWRTYPTLLSGGEKQRVNLAAGILAPPRLLLLDEPVSALDPANRDAVLDVIETLSGQGVTVLSVFHHRAAIERLATRVVVMDRGRVVDEGQPHQVLVGEVAATT